MYIQLQILLYIANKVAIFSATTLAVYFLSFFLWGWEGRGLWNPTKQTCMVSLTVI